MLNFKDAAALLGVGDGDYVSFLVDTGHLRSVRYRTMRLIYRRDLEAFADKCYRTGHMPEHSTRPVRRSAPKAVTTSGAKTPTLYGDDDKARQEAALVLISTTDSKACTPVRRRRDKASSLQTLETALSRNKAASTHRGHL